MIAEAFNKALSPCMALSLAGLVLAGCTGNGDGGAYLGQPGLSAGSEDLPVGNAHDTNTATDAARTGPFAAAQAAWNSPRAGSVTQSSDADELGVTVDTASVEISVSGGQDHYAVSYNGLELASTQNGTAAAGVSNTADRPKGTLLYERADGSVEFYRSVESQDVEFGKHGPASATWGLPPGDIWIDIWAVFPEEELQQPASGPATDRASTADYLARGTWVYVPDDATRLDDYEYGAFADGSDPFVQDNLAGLTGTASYVGEDTASGVYATRDRQKNYFFDADVSLTADFGAGLELGTVHGRIHDIEIDDLTLPGAPQLLLRGSTIGAADSGFLVGNTSLNLAGRTLTGKWGAQFYGNGDAATHRPGSVAGTFGAASADGRETFLGAFSADTSDRIGLIQDLMEQNSDVAEFLATPVAQGQSPGLLAAVIDPDGVVAVASAGLRRQGSTEAFTVNDRVHIGSDTKAMTSAMLATLVADGTFPGGWDTTIAEVFPELSETIAAGYRSVTLSQLVRMQGGIAPNATNWLSHASNADLIARRYGILRDNLQLAPAGATGDFLYSNLSYMVAGAMAERLTGNTWEALMEERLFVPLGITTAGFGAPGTPGGTDQPWGHRRNAVGDWVPSQFDNPQALGPAGTVHLSIADWAKFVSLWFPSKEPAVLDRDTLTDLVTPKSGTYAAGWGVVSRTWAGGTALAHAGSNTYWHSILWIAPNRDIAYLAVANSSDDDTFTMLDGIIASLIGETWERDEDAGSGGSAAPLVVLGYDFEMLAKANSEIKADAVASVVAAARGTGEILSGSMVAQHGGAIPAEIVPDDRATGLTVLMHDGGKVGSPKATRQGHEGVEWKTVSAPVQQDGRAVTRETYVVRYGDIGTPAKDGNDAGYLTWGFWMQFDGSRQTFDAADAVTAGVFVEGTDPASFEAVAEFTGTAVYEGEATGLYADADGVSHFDASVSLAADFGGGTAEPVTDGQGREQHSAGRIWGTISDFHIDGTPVPGIVFLEESAIVRDGTDEGGRAAVFSGTTSGTLAGHTFNRADGSERDRWGGMMFRVDHASDPDRVAGTFGASTADATVGVVGAFQAGRP